MPPLLVPVHNVRTKTFKRNRFRDMEIRNNRRIQRDLGKSLKNGEKLTA